MKTIFMDTVLCGLAAVKDSYCQCSVNRPE